MYLSVSPSEDCAQAWVNAFTAVDSMPHHEAYNVIIDVANPTRNTFKTNPIIQDVEDFMRKSGKSVFCVANTIFPEALYRQYGAEGMFDVFNKNILPKVRKKKRWSGYYFERMTAGDNELWRIVTRIRDSNNKALNKFELSIYDAKRDVDNSPYGGQCLSFLSFKVIPGSQKQLALTAIYRNHYYTEKLLGNLIGLGRLLSFVAKEGGINVGPLTVLSTHAMIDQPGNSSRAEVNQLIKRCAGYLEIA